MTPLSPPQTPEPVLQRAVTLHQSGRWQEAEHLYREILQRHPHHPDANHNLGLLALQLGAPTAALPFLKTALEADPGQAQYWLSYVDGLRHDGQHDAARQVLARGISHGALRDTPNDDALIDLYRQRRYPELEQQARVMTATAPEHGFGWKVLALAIQQQGRVDEALTVMQKALELLPDDAEIHGNLGVMWMELGRLVEAEVCYRQALALRGDHAEACNNLGMLLHRQNRPDEAEEAFGQALRIKPDYINAHYNLALLLQEQKHWSKAETAFRKLLHLKPDHFEAFNHLGMLLAEQHRLLEAENAYRQALMLNPQCAEAYYNLGNTLRTQNRLIEAETSYFQALSRKPDLVAAHCNLGILYYRQGHPDRAANQLHKGLAHLPDDVESLYNLGIIQHEQGLFDAAETSCRRALKSRPDHAALWNNLGNTLIELNRPDEAEPCFRQALACRPDYAAAHFNLGNLLYDLVRLTEAGTSFRRAAELDPDLGSALVLLCHCAQHLCDWRTLRADTEAVRRALTRKVATPMFPLLSLPLEDGLLLRHAGASSIQQQIAPLLRKPPLVDPRHHPRRERLRIGYLSADFRNHPVTQLLAAVIETHDSRRFQVHCFAYGPDTRDEGRQRIIRACDRFHDLKDLSDHDSAALIAREGIDILLDLSGNMQHHRIKITACRPAPLLVNFSFPGSMGHARVADYKISDTIASPPHMAEQFSETLALMPHSQQPNDRNQAIATSPSRQEAGLPDEGLVFCSFNQNYKFNPDGFTVWCRLLDQVPGSVLWLPASNPIAMQNLRQEALQRGVAANRLVFAPRMPTLPEHLGRLALADLALDTFPYNSQTTGSDALWSGVPMVTRMGTTFVSRIAAGMLHAVGLPELVTRSWEEYYELALDLALNPDRLQAIRQRLRSNRLTHPLFDTERFARDLERLLERMWRDHAAGKREMIILEDAPE
ncbi:MAG: tetratricopeptide repeat protein [Magnetococcales bacterium]|nr:tetratricopeptide repeat protein [Magnetococcales bacterium]